MSEAKVGRDFIKHELDEAIAIQRVIVDAEEKLSRSHPYADAKRALKGSLKADRQQLTELETLGREHGASGTVEDVAGSMKQLMEESADKASEAESEAYEAHAVLVSLKRKQQDSAGAMLKIARTRKDTKMRDAARDFERQSREGARELAAELAAFAARIATAGSSAGGGSARSR